MQRSCNSSTKHIHRDYRQSTTLFLRSMLFMVIAIHWHLNSFNLVNSHSKPDHLGNLCMDSYLRKMINKSRWNIFYRCNKGSLLCIHYCYNQYNTIITEKTGRFDLHPLYNTIIEVIEITCHCDRKIARPWFCVYIPMTKAILYSWVNYVCYLLPGFKTHQLSACTPKHPFPLKQQTFTFILWYVLLARGI